MKTKIISAAVAIAALCLAPAAQAHVTVQPGSVPAGGFARLDVRVPNERDNAATQKVELKMPGGFIFVSYEPVPGWSTVVKKKSLAEPIESHGEQITEQVDSVTWTANDPSAAIQAGQFEDFGLSVGVPESAQEGDTLTFPAIQTYDNDEVVRWIGAPDSEEPASEVSVTAPEEEHGAASEDEAGDDDEDEGAPMWLSILGVVFGGGGLLAGAIALRRKP
jgi:uncharacterized protein YcnI